MFTVVRSDLHYSHSLTQLSYWAAADSRSVSRSAFCCRSSAATTCPHRPDAHNVDQVMITQIIQLSMSRLLSQSYRRFTNRLLLSSGYLILLPYRGPLFGSAVSRRIIAM